MEQANLNELPVVLGSSATGILVSLALSRKGIEHVFIGTDDPPPDLPRLGESIIDTSSPELWRLYGHEFADCFHYKNHISYLNGDFSAMCHVASPRRTRKLLYKFSYPDGRKTRYPWFGEALFHLDRIKFDRAAYFKARAEKSCRYLVARVSQVKLDPTTDQISALELEGGGTIERPTYVFDCTGFASPISKAAKIKMTPLSTPQRVVWSHYRRPEPDENPDEWWRGGTNILRLDREHDGVDGLSWLIGLGTTMSCGFSIDQSSERANDSDVDLIERLEAAWRRRGVDFMKSFPERQPIQQLRHSYFMRDRAYGGNWLLVGPTFITIWFPGSTGLWTVMAAAGMAHQLIKNPALGKFYERSMRQLTHFHYLLDNVLHGPVWKSSFQVFHFFGKGGALIWSRVSDYLRIRDDDYGWFRPSAWVLNTLELVGRKFSPFMVLFFVAALVRSRFDLNKKKQGRPFRLYEHTIPFRVWNAIRWLPHFLWSSIPRRRMLPSAASE